MHRVLYLVAIVITMMVATLSIQAEEQQIYSGKVYELGSNKKKVLFDWQKIRTVKPGSVHSLVLFSAPGGKPVTREEVWYEGTKVKRYELKKLQNGEEARVTVENGKVEFYFRDGSGEVSRGTEDYAQDVLVADQISDYIRANWDALQKGDTLKVRYVVPQRTETVGFKFFKDEESQCNGEKSMVIKMKPSSFIISAFVDPLYFNFSLSGDHDLCDYRGRTTPLLKDGDGWKPLDAHTFYNAPIVSRWRESATGVSRGEAEGSRCPSRDVR